MLQKLALAAALVTAGLSTANAQNLGSSRGAVFAATNDVKQNEVIMYDRAPSGSLSLVGKFPTGGRGEGGINDPLQSDYSIALTKDHEFLLVVNAGSSNISVFRVRRNGLLLTSITRSGGGNPISIAVHNGLVYVVNYGGNVHTAGFQLTASGKLQPVPGSIMPLSSLDSGASTAAFYPDGSKLVVTERLTNLIDVFTVNPDGSLSNPVFNPSVGQSPFGVQFTPSGALLVTNAPPANSSTTSYIVNPDNTLSTVTSQASSSGGAACWVATNGQYAWVSNTTTSDVGAYSVSYGGDLKPLGISATEAPTGPSIFPKVNPPTSFPLDLALSQDGAYLYVNYSGTGEIVGYKVTAGALSKFTAVSAFKSQSGAEGLAVY